MFEQFPVVDLVAVAAATTVETSSQYSKHQLTVATTDSAGALATAGAGTFAVQFRAHKLAALEDLLSDAGIALQIDAADPGTVKFEASICEVVVTPTGITGATHYTAILKSGD